MEIVYLNFCPQRNNGLCNQLYSIVNACVQSNQNNIKYIFMSKFLKQANSNDYCNISEIIDIKKTNSFLKKYNITLFDYYNVKFTVNYVIYNSKNVTDIFISKFKHGNSFIIKKDVNIHDIFYDHGYRFKSNESIFNDDKLCLEFQIDETIFKYNINILTNGSLEYEININFSGECFFNLTTPVINDNSKEFLYVLRNIYFCEKISTISNNYVIENIDIKQKINAIHLRLENDAIEHWVKESIYTDPLIYKKAIENKYINIINNYINKDDNTIIICYDYNNAVVEYLDKNNYKTFKTPKFDTSRDVAAIYDLLIAQNCNNVFVGVFESSFSFSVMNRINNRTNIIPIIFNIIDFKDIQVNYHR
jgi:hypothetical protein